VDVLASLTVFAGIKISEHKSKQFPYGLYKVENLVSLATSFAIFFAAYEIVVEVIESSPDIIFTNIPIAITGMLIASGISFLFSRYELKTGLKSGSPSLVADAKHIRTDLLSNTVIIAGLIAGLFNLNIDRYIALIIAVFVVKMGWGILYDSLKVILDATVDYSTLDKIKHVMLEFPGVMEVKTLMGRQSGRFKFIESRITLKAKTLDRAHEICSSVEEEINDIFPEIDKIIIHYEPVVKEQEIIAVPLSDDVQRVSEYFGKAPNFLLLKLNPSSREIVAEEILKNPYIDVEKKRGVRVAQWLAHVGVTGLILRDNIRDTGPYYALLSEGIDVDVVDEDNVERIKEIVMRNNISNPVKKNDRQ